MDVVNIPPQHLYLGGTPTDGAATPLFLKASDLTTHGVIVGMTGSGKTGLGIILIEEILLSELPALVLDPKGDLGVLLLTFPELAGSDFLPWISRHEAQREGMDPAQLAQRVATTWREGLAHWGLTPERIGQLRRRIDFTLYTPGSTAGVPLNILGSLRAPERAADLEAMRDEVEGFVSSLLTLIGINGDPLSCREHILLANLIEHAWQQGSDLDLARLLGQVQDPPLRKLGVIDIDAFFPKPERRELELKLNGLLASPAFAAWMEGPALDVGSMLYTEEGKPRAAIVNLAHLAEDERQLVVTLLLSKLITWMRSQPGSEDLRALVYMDEVFGFVPPTAAPPSKKPILTILKQARAFGVGMVLATQNPVDIDYKALSNAGTWMVGRLQTERDKARLLDGLTSAVGGPGRQELEAIIGGLDKRQFLLHSTKRDTPDVFGTRWAMSYLRGPMTREEIRQITKDAPERTSAPVGVEAPATNAAAEKVSGSVVAPEVAVGVPVYYLHPAADWGVLPSVRPGSTTLEAAAALRVNLLYDDDRAGVRHTEEWEAVLHPLTWPAMADDAIAFDYDARDLMDSPPAGATYVLPKADLHSAAFFKEIGELLHEHLYRTRTVRIFRNKALKLYSRVGETKDAFAARCDTAAEAAEDAAVAELRERFGKRIDRIQEALARAEDRLEEVRVDQSTRKTDEIVSGVGTLLTAFLGGRRGSRSLAAGLRRASSKRAQTRRVGQRLSTAVSKVEDKQEELEALEEELAEAVLALDETWAEKALAVEEVEIGLEKSDIRVAEVALVWIPV